jgi:hypothetical protein
LFLDGLADGFIAGTPKGVGQVKSGDTLKASLFVGDELTESFEIGAVDRVDKDGIPY